MNNVFTELYNELHSLSFLEKNPLKSFLIATKFHAILIFFIASQKDYKSTLEDICYNISSKVIYMTLSLFSITIFAFYNGVITSEMTFQSPSPRIKSMQDILNYGADIKLHKTVLFYFEGSPPNSPARKVLEMMLEQDPELNNRDKNVISPTGNAATPGILSSPSY